LRYVGPRLVEISNRNYGESYRYDNHGRLVELSRKLDRVVFSTRYRYDAKTGQLIEKTLPGGQTLRFHHDEQSGRLRAVTRRSNVLMQTPLIGEIEYAPFGPVTGYVQGNGVHTTRRFDRGGALREVKADGVISLTYSFDKTGKIVGVTSRARATGGVQESKETYRFDKGGRIASAENSKGTSSFYYDRSGNRIRMVRRGEVEHAVSYGFERTSNRLEKIVDSQGRNEQLRYDLRGNPVDIGSKRFEYSVSNRPVRLFVDGKIRARYWYNLRGERIKKVVYDKKRGTRTTYFLYEQGQLVAEAADGGEVTDNYVYLGHVPVARLHQGQIQYIHSDHIGLPRVITDESRRVVWSASYSPFGRAAIEISRTAFQLRFPGQYEDEESGSYYNVQRQYDPDSGRYLTPDPAGFPDGPNSYVYALNDPVHRADPWGLATITYFALTTNSSGSSLGSWQGFTKARWAFYISDIQPDPTSTTSLQSAMAQNGTRMIFDPNGSFIGSAADPLVGTGNFVDSLVWGNGDQDLLSLFRNHYGQNLIELDNFTIDIDDSQAAQIIDILRRDPTERQPCVASINTLLPTIPFADEEEDITVTSTYQTSVPGLPESADLQRILACGAGSDADLDQRRIEKSLAAAELNEMADNLIDAQGRRYGKMINRDCSADGCPFTPAYLGRYVSSYGRVQFIGTTFTLLLDQNTDGNAANGEFTANELQQLGIGTPGGITAANIRTARREAEAADNWAAGLVDTGASLGTLEPLANLATVWATPVTRGSVTRTVGQWFVLDTGLTQTEFADMMRINANPPANLLNDARNAFGTFAMMQDPVFGPWADALFRTPVGGAYDMLARKLLVKNLADAKRLTGVNGYTNVQDEQRLMRRVAALHNGSGANGDYANRFIGSVRGHGEYASLRCTESLGGIAGLQISPLVFR